MWYSRNSKKVNAEWITIFSGFVMPTESEQRSDYKDRIVLPIAGIFFFLQFVGFMYNYNFHGIIFLTWFGWLLLIPGFLLIIVSETTWKKHDTREEVHGETYVLNIVKTYVSGLTSHPLYDGWLMISVALALISQYWLTVFCMGVQIPLIIFNIYSE